MADSGHAPRGDEECHTHDPELIAALLDRDLPDAERAFAQARLVACSSCAVLHADLIALATANLELATPTRPRDFALTLEAATTLVQQGAGEPVPSGARLTGEMTDSRSRHAAHDRLLIANLVDRSVSDSERTRGEEQLAACRDCTLLHADLVALSAATRALSVPARPRDFTLTPADAQRVRVHGWRRMLAAIGSTRDVFSRPLALGLTTLGLAGLLVATIPTALTGPAASPERQLTVDSAVGDATGGAGANPETLLRQASAAPPEPESGAAAAAPAPSPSATSAAAPAPAASADPGDDRLEPDVLFQGSDSSPATGEPDGAVDLYRAKLLDEEPSGRSAMVGVASLLLLVGLALFAVRWAARRFGDG